MIKNTKRALLLSVFSMMLCCVVLIGSTFAWFTDSVTSGMNKIVAGNLDVEMEYSLDGNTWTTVDERTNMFKEGALWEPGRTEVVYLQVKNVGSLALKYRFGINVADIVIGKTADDKDIDLADFIEFGVAEADAAFVDSDAAREAVKDTAGRISAGYSSAEGRLTAGSTSKMFALVVYMPEDVGNDANHGNGSIQPEIYLGINLSAAQCADEADSFGSDYDANAELLWYGNIDNEGLAQNTDDDVKTVKIETPDQLAAFARAVNSGKTYAGYTVELVSDINLNNVAWMPIGNAADRYFEGTFDGNGHTISNLRVIGSTTSNATSNFYKGLFGHIENTAVITDFILNNVNVSGYNYVGGVCGCTNRCREISDIIIKGKVNIQGNQAVGGICGRGYTIMTKNCVIEADEGSIVCGRDVFVGGLFGFCGTGSQVITDCSSNIDVTGWARVGGISGILHFGNTIENCQVNDITITMTCPANKLANQESYKSSIGAVAGTYGTGSNVSTKDTVKNCTGSATLITEGNISNGGIIGNNTGGGVSDCLVLIDNNITILP